MAMTILENIKGNEIPPRWAKMIPDSLDQPFTVIIKSQRGFKKGLIQKRNRILDLLEENKTGGESSMDQTDQIRPNR